MAYIVPQLQITQEFTEQQIFSEAPLSVLVIGPHIPIGTITGIAVGTAGSGYINPPTVTITDTSGGQAASASALVAQPYRSILTVAVGDAGSGYTTVPLVTISDSTGTGANIVAVLGTGESAGTIASFSVVAGGKNYTSPTLTVTGGGGSSGAAGTITYGTGAITGYTINDGGYNYNSSTATAIVTAPDHVGGTQGVPGTITVVASRVLSTQYSGSIGSVTSVAQVTQTFGDITPDNPLAYGLAAAITNASNTTVYYCAVASDDPDGYSDALALAEKSRTYYAIVPLTTDATTHNNVVTHCYNMSDPTIAKWRVCWLSPAVSGQTGDESEITDFLNKCTAASNVAGYTGSNINAGPRRVHYVFPGVYLNAAQQSCTGMFLCAALAGLRAGSPPHQSLTNTQVIEPYDLSACVSIYSEDQLDELATAGVWIVTQDQIGGTAYTRHQLTAVSLNSGEGLNYREDSITANVDSISFGLREALAPFIGIYNISPAAILKVHSVVDNTLSYYLTKSYTERAGNQLLGYAIVSIGQDALENDKINVTVTLQVPYPMNFITVSLSI